MLSRLCNGICNNASSSVFHVTRGLALSSIRGARSNFSNKFAQTHAFKIRQQAGTSLKERLLGPTTGKPYLYGTYALIGGSAFGIGLLCYYGLGITKEQSLMDRAAIWPEYVRTRLHHTYGYLAGGLAITAGAGLAAARSPRLLALTSNGSLVTFAVSLAAIIGTGMLARSIDYNNTIPKHLAWALHAGVMGAVLAPLVFVGGPVLFRAAWYTAGLVGGLSALAMCAPSEKFLNMGAPLAMGLGVVFVANIGAFFFPPGTALGAGLYSIVLYGGLILFSAFLLYDTQRIVKHAEMTPEASSRMAYNQFGQPMTITERGHGFDPINASISLYLDIINIFIRMVMLSGGQRRK
uniref:Growth hormone-inducible transmembrane protein n=1 Tax=Acrobeloides nanus TaxID=290746 RepID=A0A914BVF7_9BILA